MKSRTTTRIWEWLSQPRNQKTLTFIGGGIAAVTIAGWTLYTHLVESRSAHQQKEISQSLAGSGTAIVQTGNGTIYISNTQGISADDYARIAAELGVTQSALRVFFNILEKKQVKIEDLDRTLRDIAAQYKALRKEVDELSGDSATTKLRKQAVEALDAGDFNSAEKLLKRIYDLNVEAAKKFKTSVEERLVVAAVSLAELGELKSSQLAFAEASTYYRRAAELVPVSTTSSKRAEYLYKQSRAALVAGNLAEAEQASIDSIAIQEHTKSDNVANFATTISELATVYQQQGRYGEAESQYQRAVSTLEKKGKHERLLLVTVLEGLAVVYRKQGRYSQALAVLNRAMTLEEQVREPNQIRLAIALNNMGVIYGTIGRHAEAEPLLNRALTIQEKEFGSDHLVVAATLGNLGTEYEAQGRYVEAERHQQRVLTILERYLGRNHLLLGNVLNNLMTVSAAQKKFDEAENYGKRALSIRLRVLGQTHPDVAVVLGNLSGLYRDQGRYPEAEEYNQRALSILEKTLGPTHPEAVLSLGISLRFMSTKAAMTRQSVIFSVP